MKVRVKNTNKQEQDLSQQLVSGHVYGLITEEDDNGYNKHGGIAALYCNDRNDRSMVDLRTGEVIISYDEGVCYMEDLIGNYINGETVTAVQEFKFGELTLIKR